MEHTRLAEDDARRIRLHDEVKSTVDRQVEGDIRRSAATTSADDDRIVEVAAELHGKAVDESAQGERRLGQARVAARGSQFLDYGFYMLYSLLAMRLALALIAARSGNGFVQFIRAATEPFLAPFRDIVSSPTAAGGYTLAIPVVIALVVYMMLHAAINGLLRMVAHRKTVV